MKPSMRNWTRYLCSSLVLAFRTARLCLDPAGPAKSTAGFDSSAARGADLAAAAAIRTDAVISACPATEDPGFLDCQSAVGDCVAGNGPVREWHCARGVVPASRRPLRMTHCGAACGETPDVRCPVGRTSPSSTQETSAFCAPG